MKIICYGDSNTYGFDPRSYFGGQYDADCRWVDILEKNTSWEVQNWGENGREIPAGNLEFPTLPDLLIIMLGTNDLLQGADADCVAQRMEAFVMALSVEKEKILLVSPPPMKLGAWVSDGTLIESSAQLAERYQTLAENLGIKFTDAGKWNTPLTFDGVHLSEEGHIRFAEEIRKEIFKWFT